MPSDKDLSINNLDQLVYANKKTKNHTLYLLSQYPSAGKTTAIVDFIKNSDLKVMVFSVSHNILNEYAKHLPMNIYEHWYGFSKICPIDSFREKAKISKINASFFCRSCQKLGYEEYTECKYRKQFKTNKKVILATLNYINTRYTRDFKPDIIFIEENAFKERILKQPKQINALIDIFLKNFKGYKFLPYYFKHPHCIFDIADMFRTKHKTIDKVVKNYFVNKIKSKDEVEKVLKLMPEEIIKEIAQYFRYTLDFNYPGLIGSKQREEIPIPILFDAFDLMLNSNTIFVLSDATLRPKLLEKHIDNYEYIKFEEDQPCLIKTQNLSLDNNLPSHHMFNRFSVIFLSRHFQWNKKGWWD
jgi:hypothetical protein